MHARSEESHGNMPKSWLLRPPVIASYFRSRSGPRTVIDMIVDLYGVPRAQAVHRLTRFRRRPSGAVGSTGGNWRRAALRRRLKDAAKLLAIDGLQLQALRRAHPHDWTRFECVRRLPGRVDRSRPTPEAY